MVRGREGGERSLYCGLGVCQSEDGAMYASGMNKIAAVPLSFALSRRKIVNAVKEALTKRGFFASRGNSGYRVPDSEVEIKSAQLRKCGTTRTKAGRVVELPSMNAELKTSRSRLMPRVFRQARCYMPGFHAARGSWRRSPPAPLGVSCSGSMV